MSNYEQTFVERLKKLTHTQQSIQSLSFWVMYHTRRHTEIVRIWEREITRTKPSRIILFLYLANDVLQNSRKKTNNYLKSFENVLPNVIKHACMNITKKDSEKLSRLFKIWEERKLFSRDFITNLKKHQLLVRKNATTYASENTVPSPSPVKKREEKNNSILKHPIVKELNNYQLVKLKGTSSGVAVENSEILQKEFDDVLFPENLEKMNIEELKELQKEFQKSERKYEKIKEDFGEQKEISNSLCKVLKLEMENQEKENARLNEINEEWGKNTNKVKDFLTQIELSINSKEIDDFHDFSFMGENSIIHQPTNNFLKKRPFEGTNSYEPPSKKQKKEEEMVVPPEISIDESSIDELLNI